MRDTYKGYDYKWGGESEGIAGKWFYRIEIFRKGVSVREEKSDPIYNEDEALEQGKKMAQAIIDQLAMKNSK